MKQYNLLANNQSVPSQTVNIYRLRDPEVNPDNVRLEARRFGMIGEGSTDLYEDSEKIAYRDGDKALVFYRNSGAMAYRDRSRSSVNDGVTDLVLADDEAADLAHRYLGQLELVPQGEYVLAKVLRTRIGLVDVAGTDSQERTVEVGAAFRRIVDGIPVDGPGGYISICFDREGLTSCEKVWRDIVAVERSAINLHPPSYAEQDLMRERGVGGNGIITVQRISLAHFELGQEIHQNYLQPAYTLDLVMGSASGRFTMGSKHVVLAALEPVADDMPRRTMAIYPTNLRS